MKISVVIPTYKRPKLLLRCLDALSKQSLSNHLYEVLVVSDGPDEETEAIVSSLKNKELSLRYFFPDEKKGPAACRNIGWKHAAAPLIAFTDDDCIPAADWLQSILNFYKGEERIAFTGQVIVPRTKFPTDYELNTSNLETAEFVTANCICTKKALELVAGFDERFSMAWREDSDLHFKLINQNIPIQKVEAVVIHPVRKAPWGISIREQKKGIFNALLYKKYPQLYRQRIKPSPSWNYYGMVCCVFLIVVAFVLNAGIIGISAFAVWMALLVAFIKKRLKTTSRSLDHIAEMVLTSIFIPFASVFWHLYGSIKYKVLFL